MQQLVEGVHKFRREEFVRYRELCASSRSYGVRLLSSVRGRFSEESLEQGRKAVGE